MKTQTGGMAVVENTIDIRSSPEEVEPKSETRGKGERRPDRSRNAVRGGVLEGQPHDYRVRALRPPDRVGSVGRSRRLDARSEGRVSVTEKGARLVMRMELRPTGALRLLLPILGRFMHRQQERNLAAISAALEASGATAARRGA